MAGAQKAALPPPVVHVDAAKIEAAKVESAKAVAELTVKAHLARAANPVPVARRPIVPLVAAPPQRLSRTSLLITAAAVIVVAIGAAGGARRFGFLLPTQTAREAQPVQTPPAAESVTVGERPATPPDIRPAAKVVVENRARAIAPAPAAASPKPRTASPRGLAPSSGRLFERKDVDELPKVATRVEPRFPANLPRRPRNEIVVVRVLVSRTGRPSRVSLLRGSTLGRSSDEAVVAAVARWTFSPAKKRGEAVNCWFNIALRLGQAT
jgi:TonB family protein